jgi:hypothetical protein
MATVEEKVDKLEQALQSFITSVGTEFNKAYDLHMRLEIEFKEFKDEMRQQTREMNQKWGEMANKLGTLVEDLVAPSLPRIIREQFELDVTDLMVRRKKKLGDGRTREFDAIAVARDYVFLNYTVSTLRPRDVDTFPGEITALREFLPEYAGLKVVGILASLYIDPGVIAYAEKAGFMVLAVGDQLMEVKNSPGFKPKEW